MPKGYNKDGSKKVRPANSGRKTKEGQKIHSKLAVDVIQILSKLENPIAFIENAIREKAARGFGQRTFKIVPPGSIDKNIQIDLLDLIEEIKKEKELIV